MTTLLEEAIEQLRELPAEEQDAAADVLFAYISSDERQYHLQPHQAEEVRRIRRDLATGRTHLVADKELAVVRNKLTR